MADPRELTVIDINHTKRKLKECAETVIFKAQRVIAMLERGDERLINSLGELQFSGVEMDVMCGRLGALLDVLVAMDAADDKPDESHA